MTERFQKKVSKKSQTCENTQSRILADPGEGREGGGEGGEEAAGNRTVMQNVRHL